MQMIRILIGMSEVVDLNPMSLSIETELCEPYIKAKDTKWIKFCKEHHFNPVKDANGKIYELYLQLCAEGLL